MREIGGYIELDTIQRSVMHEKAIALNTARNCLAYLIRAKSISRILLPKFLCDSIKEVCIREKVEISYYSVNETFRPVDVTLKENEWLYLVNYYGQFDNDELEKIVREYKNVIIDNVQAYFQEPINCVDTIYTCRKFFGVPDGAFLYSSKELNEVLEKDESYTRMGFLLGRFERTATEFYDDYRENERKLAKEPIKRMSCLTHNLLAAVDYSKIKSRRTENYKILYDAFREKNKLVLKEIEAPFSYPLYVSNGEVIRKELQKKKIYIPTLWPEVLEHCSVATPEYDMAKNILPLPIDQRYGCEEMQYIIEEVSKYIE